MADQLSPASIIERIAIVSAQLHDEQGDREELLRERAQLVEIARRREIFPFNSHGSNHPGTAPETQ